MPRDIENLLKETRERARYFQTVHAWPLDDQLNYEGWLSNFHSNEELRIACSIIDFFLYYPDYMINQMLKTTIGYAGHYLSKKYPDWTHNDFISRCYFSFIPGESQNPTDSGRLFLRKIRDEVGIPEDRLIEYNDIPLTLEGEHRSCPVILIDDFVGSGDQCIRAWNSNRFDHGGKTLREISTADDHIFIYSPLIVNHIGYNKIISFCRNLIIEPAHILGPEYNLFRKECFCWKGDEETFNNGVDLILKKSSELGIPFSNGRSTQDVRGYKEQGLAIAFEHGAPDAIPAFFYWCHEDWIPLIRKTYER